MTKGELAKAIANKLTSEERRLLLGLDNDILLMSLVGLPGDEDLTGAFLTHLHSLEPDAPKMPHLTVIEKLAGLSEALLERLTPEESEALNRVWDESMAEDVFDLEDIEIDPNDPVYLEGKRTREALAKLTEQEKAALITLGSPKRVLEKMGLPVTEGNEWLISVLLFDPTDTGPITSARYQSNHAYFQMAKDMDEQAVAQVLTGLVERLAQRKLTLEI